jgi:hypothetical protein
LEGKCALLPLTSPTAHFASFYRFIDPALSQKFAKLKKATENGHDSPTPSTASSVATPQTTPTQPTKKTIPAPSGSKRKAATTYDDASDAQKRKKKREVKKEPASDGDHGGDVLGHVRDDGVDLGKQNDRTVNGEQTETPA